MRGEYFSGKVEKIIEETNQVEVPVTQKVGWFKKIVHIEMHPEKKYYAICSLLGAKFLLKIPIEKEEYDNLKIGDDVSLHLKFDFNFACFHYSQPIMKEPKIYEIAKEKDD